ncbi:hypothetical protein B0H21DRAFT_310429 [Amylocystis lapponica]|nr:hypothetical protein B0H21DRAFT_310429 [Amylocystis lapponica]
MVQNTKTKTTSRQSRVLFQHYSEQNKEMGTWLLESLQTMTIDVRPLKSRGRRNPGKDDGRNYNSGRFICAAAVDGDGEKDVRRRGKRGGAKGARALIACDEYDLDTVPSYSPPAQHKVDLLDIAKPAKPRVARARTGGFEMVDTVSRVVALEDDAELSEDDSEDWERVEQDIPARKTYSEVLLDDFNAVA